MPFRRIAEIVGCDEQDLRLRQGHEKKGKRNDLIDGGIGGRALYPEGAGAEAGATSTKCRQMIRKRCKARLRNEWDGGAVALIYIPGGRGDHEENYV